MPIQPPKGGDEKQVCHNPCHGVAETDTLPCQGWHQPQAHAAPGYHLHHPAHHREHAVTQALDAVPEDGEQTEHGVEIVGNAHKLGGMGYYLRLALVYEEHHHLVGEGVDEEEGNHKVHQHHLDGRPHALRHPFQLPGTEVLTAIGGHRHADVLKHTGKEVLDAHGGGECRHIDRAQSIVGTLEHDEADGGDGELKAHRHTVVQQDARLLVVKPALLALGDENLHLPLDVPDAESHGEALRQPGGDARPLYAKPHAENEDAVEDDVDDGGGDEKIKRLLRVAEGTDLSREQIIGNGKRYRRKLEHEEDVGIVEHLGWGVDEMQNLAAEDAGEEGDDHGEDHGDADAVAYIGAHFHVVFGTESLRHGDGEACARTVAETHDEEGDGAGCPHSRQCSHTYPAAHDGGVNDEVHLLQNVSQYQRDGKGDDVSQGRAYCHVVYLLLAHSCYPFFYLFVLCNSVFCDSSAKTQK